MNKHKLGIIGYGIVGQALGNGFKDQEIHFHDKYKPSDSLEDVVENSEFIFICLPTPVHEAAGMDLSIIEESIKQVAKLTGGTDKIIVIKSSVIPGTTRHLAAKYPGTLFAFNPEFLTEANYLEDFINSDRHVIGADNSDVSNRISELYHARFPDTPIHQTDPTSAEMAKFMANTYLAMKVIFANEMHDIAERIGADYPSVKKMVTADRRIFDSHLDVTPERGFGGKCFPKDISSLITLGEELGADVLLLRTVWEKNLKIRTVYDWLEIPFAVTQRKDLSSKKKS